MSFESRQFKPGQGGRTKGARNRLSMSFVTALAKEFEEFGEESIRICRIERPHEFLKIVASLLPKEFELTDSRLTEITDEELDRLLEVARRQITGSVVRDTDSREAETVDRKPIKLLSAIRQAKDIS
jgi:hypothetical protein